jgi:hypothetical protein
MVGAEQEQNAALTVESRDLLRHALRISALWYYWYLFYQFHLLFKEIIQSVICLLGSRRQTNTQCDLKYS